MKASVLTTAGFSSLAFAQRPSAAITTETIYSCPSALTEYLTLTVAFVPDSTLTEALPTTTTTTEVAIEPSPTTAYLVTTAVQTVTTTVFNVSVSTIIPPPVTQTSTTYTTTSETLYPIISTWTTTEQVTSLTICPTRTLNPTFTAQYPIPTEFTWGCPPGYLCKPDQINCNFEAGLPSENFYCSPDQCMAASALGVPQVWDSTTYGNSTPATDPSLRFNAIDHYFNMNPQDYGLTYEIFVEDEAFTFTSTVGYAPTAALAARQAETSVPGTCYPWCNDCLLEAQSVGKTPALCAPDSNYEKDLANCQQCIAYHASDNSGSFVQIAPQFQQFMAYCDALSAPPPSPSPPVTIYSTSTLTVQPELSLSSKVTITYSTTSSYTATTVSSVVSPNLSATSSTTDWLVPSGSTTIVFHSSPAVTTQWTMTSNSSTIIFATSPIISASVIMYGANYTSTVPLLTTSATSITTSSASSITIPTSSTASITASQSKSSASSTTPASSTFSGAASRNVRGLVGENVSLLSILSAALLLIAGEV